MKPGRVQRLLFYGIIGLLFIGIGLGPGIWWGQRHRAAHSRAEQQLGDESAGSSRQLQELPPVGSPEAAKLLENQDTPECVLVIYSYLSDAAVITQNSTAAFLQALQRWQQAAQPNSTLDVQPFVEVARDMLGYFRLRYSEALLVLLRQFSKSGALVPTAVNPDGLQQEIQELLDTANLNSYYAAVSRGCEHTAQRGLQTAAEATTDVTDAATGVTQVKVTGRRLLQQKLGMLPASRRSYRHLQRSWAAQNTSSLPTQGHSEPDGGAAVNSTAVAADAQELQESELYSISRHLQQQQQQQQGSIPGTLQDTVCLVPLDNWPALDPPPDINFPCPKPTQQPYLAGFKPVELPVVFHCLRYPSEDGRHVLPAIESPEEAAANLINVANKQFDGSGFRFKLQEVRTDTKKYPYLLLPSLAKWQECSVNRNNKELLNKGLDCLAKIAADPSLEILASQLVINVIVSSSNLKPFCASKEDVTCNQMIWGYAEADGPWFNANVADSAYQEGDSTKNWLWIRFTELDVGGRNNANAWDAGGSTVAHELAHYLALLHTHEGGCEGAQADKGDGVADTAVSDDLETLDEMDPADLYLELQTWCTRFRDGAEPLVKDLKRFNSCPKPRRGQLHAADAAIDNVFNLMAYVPEACYIGALTPGQVERLQFMVARHRPRMMDAFKTV